MGTFTEAVYDVVSGIPCGQVMGFWQVAKEAGSTLSASGVVGRLMIEARDNDLPNVPWWRVLTYTREIVKGDLERMADARLRLVSEGVEFDDRNRVLQRFWDPTQTG